MHRLKIGIVGCGAIGGALAKAVVRQFSKEAELVALYDLNNEKAADLSKKVSGSFGLRVLKLEELIRRSELVIEAASAAGSFEIARRALMNKRDIVIMSVGGIARRFSRLRALAKKYNARVYIPSGAVCGIDALKAAALSRIKKVTLTTRKSPQSFKGVEYIRKKGIALDKIKKDTLLFSGSAKEAMRLFPQNINVAGTLSIAGLGAGRTRVEIIASPSAKKNIHEVRIASSAADIFTRSENALHPDNPKTSYLAVLSAVAVLKQILEPVKVGA